MSASTKFQLSGSLAKTSILLAASFLLGSCAYDIDSAARKSDRDRLNALTIACGREHTHSCAELGDDLTHTSEESRLSTWKEEVDLPLAKRVYQLGCESGEGRACRSLVEANLATSAEETSRYRALALAYGSPVRTAQEIAAADAESQARIDKQEEGISAERTQEQLKADRDLQAAGALIQHTGDQIQQSLASAPAPSPPPTTASRAAPSPAPSPATVPARVASTSAVSSPAPQCASIQQSCSPTGPACCKALGRGNGTGDVPCERGRCCMTPGMICAADADCCDWPDAICSLKVVPSACCLPEGKSCSRSATPCCSGACLPSTGTCQ
jgi:hypothetical protein